jgi:hypothetical protein
VYSSNNNIPLNFFNLFSAASLSGITCLLSPHTFFCHLSLSFAVLSCSCLVPSFTALSCCFVHCPGISMASACSGRVVHCLRHDLSAACSPLPSATHHLCNDNHATCSCHVVRRLPPTRQHHCLFLCPLHVQQHCRHLLLSGKLTLIASLALRHHSTTMLTPSLVTACHLHNI